MASIRQFNLEGAPVKATVLSLLACALLSGCDNTLQNANSSETVETRDSNASLIQPVAQLSSQLAQIELSIPHYGAALHGPTPITFIFSTAGTPQGMLLLFSHEPVLENGHLQGGWSQSGCLGGLVSMAGMSWNGYLTLDKAQHDGLHACGSSEHEPIDTARPLTLANLPEGKIWWVVIGYDAHLLPIATSPVYFFTWKKSS